jgi:Uma2 family endonuclease
MAMRMPWQAEPLIMTPSNQISNESFRIFCGGSNCRAYSCDMKGYISETRYFHPDVIVTCDSRDRGRVQAIQSPRFLVEVLSPTTELTDRMWKLKNYCAHPTIEEYVLIDSQALKIESYHQEQNKWSYEAFENTEAITLHSLGVHFSLADAYIDVEFEETAGDPNL